MKRSPGDARLGVILRCDQPSLWLERSLVLTAGGGSASDVASDSAPAHRAKRAFCGNHFYKKTKCLPDHNTAHDSRHISERPGRRRSPIGFFTLFSKSGQSDEDRFGRSLPASATQRTHNGERIQTQTQRKNEYEPTHNASATHNQLNLEANYALYQCCLCQY